MSVRKTKACQLDNYLHIVTAVALERVPPLRDMTERHLAKALRKIGNSASSGDRNFLRALADALDDPDSHWQLLLSRSKRGRPNDIEKQVNRAKLYGPIIDEKLAEGEKKEAAIQHVMSSFGVSRAAVIRALAVYTRLKRPIPRRLQISM